MKGVEKSAVLLVSLGTESASNVLRCLEDDEVEKITLEVARLRNISSDQVETVIKDYREMQMAQNYITQGGISFAREALEHALGPRRADEVIMKVEAAMEVSAFYLLQTVETVQLTNFIQNEHPQTAALILAHLNPRKSADIVSGLPPEYQTEIMYRLGTMGKTSPELLRDIEEVIRTQMGAVFGSQLSVSGGAETVAEILNATSRAAERHILDSIRERDPELASSIKDLMFVFDDLIGVDGRDMQRILSEIDQKDLAISLKGAAPALGEKVLKNMSDRAASALQEELELMGPVRVREVDQAQRRILEVVQTLEEQEEITIRGSDDMMLQ